MSAATVGAQMPPEITLDHVAAMAAADEHHRYELSREGVLSIMPPASPEHALIVSRLVHWLYLHGFGPEEITSDCGVDVGGGRQPDLTLWAKGKPPRRARSSYAGTDGLLVAIEVISPDSEITDRVIKRGEYAAAGIPRYWLVERDEANTVQMLRLAAGGYEPEQEPRPLARLLNGPMIELT
ncbi:Uma2 family endonuclease [Catenuloplanes japonicus]|uniref:Uma2 family endonuclease n=1 Tax=Catenuloplanes japonicus TaxID=33876 RepID=UPI000524B23B|nr:Uma2 family endonuclease [Catenuloplanes japonicus]